LICGKKIDLEKFILPFWLQPLSGCAVQLTPSSGNKRTIPEDLRATFEKLKGKI